MPEGVSVATSAREYDWPERVQTDWMHIPVSCIEDLSDAVLGAGLEATQLSKAPVTGSLAFASRDGIVYSTGRLASRVALAGPLSETMITLGLGLRLTPGTRHWLHEVTTGAAGVFLPGDEHDSYYMPGSLYATVTLSAERLEQEAARIGLVLDARMLGGTGIDTGSTPKRVLAALRHGFDFLHNDKKLPGAGFLGDSLLDACIYRFGREPVPQIGGIDPGGYARIVSQARDYVQNNLESPISVDEMAAAARTSRRTLHRAFIHVLDETPQTYVRKLRLNRIRQELCSSAEAACTVTIAANHWGISELGRLSGWYRELFGELPSETLARHGREAVRLAH